jgi:hypothetical protein
MDRAMTDEIAAAVRSHRTTNKPSEKGTATVKLTTTTNVSVDGVIQGLGGPDEDRLLALHCDGGIDPGLPAHRAPAVRNGHGRLRLRR